jgi:hypothetical protein
MLDAADRRRRQAARSARDRRYRARRESGKAVAQVEFDAAILDFLIRTRWLAEGNSTVARAVGEAISAMLADAARV